MIRAHESVTRVDRGAFDNRQDVALHAFAAHIGTMAAPTPRDLVYLIPEDDAATLYAFDRHARHLIHIDQLLRFLLSQVIHRFAHAHFAFARAPREQPRQDIF